MQSNFVFQGVKDGETITAYRLSALGAKIGMDVCAANVKRKSKALITTTFDEAVFLVLLMPTKVKYDTYTREWDDASLAYVCKDTPAPLSPELVVPWLAQHSAADEVLVERRDDGILFAFRPCGAELFEDVLHVIF